MSDDVVGVKNPPKDLEKAAQRQWKKIAPVAHKFRPLTEADVPLFSMLCETLAEVEDLKKQLKRDGLIVKLKRGGSKTHPAVNALGSARAHAMRMMKLFGLSPVHRQKRELAKVETIGSASKPKENYFGSIRAERIAANRGHRQA